MKKQIFRILTMLSVLLMLTAASVHAQSQRSSFNIPFGFSVGQKALPAGEYTVEPMRRDSKNVWLVQGKRGSDSVLVTTNFVWARDTQEEARLIFNNYDGQYFLSQIWTAGDSSGRELSVPRRERQLSKNGLQHEKVVVTRGSEE